MIIDDAGTKDRKVPLGDNSAEAGLHQDLCAIQPSAAAMRRSVYVGNQGSGIEASAGIFTEESSEIRIKSEVRAVSARRWSVND
jgi:hypothetical protein